ncbi:MAG TPA: hypothetical protein VNG13_03755 [Mycobacteriales bacterium]|nr:hypothetical protein [Mycobacteriales bacterium]
MPSDRFVGGLNVPDKRWGRFDATWPLGVLTVDDGGLTLVPRGLLARVSAGLVVRLVDVTCAYPLRGRVAWRGVGFDFEDGRTAYFWTFGQRDSALDALRARGVRVSPVPRTAAAIRKPWRHSG